MDDFERASFIKMFGYDPVGIPIGHLNSDEYLDLLLSAQKQGFKILFKEEPEDFVGDLLHTRTRGDFLARLRQIRPEIGFWIPIALHRRALTLATQRPAAAEFAALLAEIALADYNPPDRVPLPHPHRDGSSLTDLMHALDRVEGLLPRFRAARRFSTPELRDLARFYGELQRITKRTTVDLLERQVALAFASNDLLERIKARLRWIAFTRSRGRLRAAAMHMRLIERDASALSGAEAMEEAAAAAAAVNVYDFAIRAYLDAAREWAARPLTPETLLKHSSLLNDMGACLRHVSRISEAVDTARHILNLPWHITLGTPSETNAYALRARVHRLHGLLCSDLDDHRTAYRAFQAEAQDAAVARDRQEEYLGYAYAVGALMNLGLPRKAVAAAQGLIAWAGSHPAERLDASAFNMLGHALSNAGDVAAAERAYTEALRLVRAAGGQSPQESQSLLALGQVLAARQDLQGAAECYGEAMEADRRNGGEFDGRIRLLSAIATTPELIDQKLVDLAVSCAVQGDAMDHLLLLESAVSVLAAAMSSAGDHAAVLQMTRDMVARAEGSDPECLTTRRWRSRLVTLLIEHGDRSEAFRLLWEASERGSLIDLLLDDPSGLPLPDDRTAVELAFDLHEEAKAHDLLARYADADLPRPDNAPAELLAQERALLRERRALRDRATAVLVQRVLAPVERLTEIDRRLNAIWDELGPIAPDYVRVRRARPARLTNIRDFLRAQPTKPSLVSFFCTQQQVHTFVVTADGHARALSAPLPRHLIEEISRRLRRTMDGDNDVFPPLAPLNGRRPWRRSLDFLKQLSALTDFLQHIDTGAPVLVSLDSPFNSLPIHALQPPDGDRYVAEIAALWYVPNASYLSTLAASRPATTGTAIVGSVPTTIDDPAAFDDSAVLTAAGWSVGTLPSTALTPDAVLETLKQQEIVHLTCHGWVNRLEPLDSGLVLSNGTSLPPPNIAELAAPLRLPFMLTIRRLAIEDLSVALLTLRACSTGHSAENADPDEADSLVNALLTTGVRTIIAGMWEVDQASSRQLLADFYRTFEGPPWRAFRDAQRAMLGSDGPYRHPYHWAALAPFGDWR
ncbi:CHAT domain-containing tetratricopeptide repeat protein [Nonomuraea wenchangensis]